MKFGEFCWNELSTPDLQKAKDFYSKMFGWKFSDHEVGDMKYTMIKKDGQEFAGIWSIPKDQAADIPPHWLSYILVENVDESAEKAQQNGATIIKIDNAGEMGRFAIMQDPTGAHIALWQTFR